MNLDKVPEEEEGSEEDFLNLSFNMPDTSLREALPNSDDNNKSKTSSKAVGLKHAVDRPSSGNKKLTSSVSPPAPKPPPGGPGPGSDMGSAPPPFVAPPKPPGTGKTGAPAPPPPPMVQPQTGSYPALKFSPKDLKLSRKKLRRAEEILKMGMEYIVLSNLS